MKRQANDEADRVGVVLPEVISKPHRKTRGISQQTTSSEGGDKHFCERWPGGGGWVSFRG